MPERDVLEDHLRREFLRQAPRFDLGASLPTRVSALVRRRQRRRMIVPVAALVAVLAAVAIPLASLRSSTGQRPGNVATGPGQTGWSAPSDIDSPTDRLTAVSCVGARFCVAVDYEGDAITYNGSGWGKKTNVEGAVHTGGGGSLLSVSCPTIRFCVAVDSGGNTIAYNGKRVLTAALVDSLTDLDAVSCPTLTFCAAGGGFGRADTYHGTTWSGPAVLSNGALWSVSCPSATFCATVDGGNAFEFNGTSWSTPTRLGPFGLQSVSCASRDFCVAIDNHGNAFTFDGTTWSPPANIDSTSPLTSVSCPSNEFCVALDASSHALIYNGTSWSRPTLIDDPGRALHTFSVPAVSCASANFCVAVIGGDAILYGPGERGRQVQHAVPITPAPRPRPPVQEVPLITTTEGNCTLTISVARNVPKGSSSLAIQGYTGHCPGDHNAIGGSASPLQRPVGLPLQVGFGSGDNYYVSREYLVTDRRFVLVRLVNTVTGQVLTSMAPVWDERVQVGFAPLVIPANTDQSHLQVQGLDMSGAVAETTKWTPGGPASFPPNP